MTYRGHIKNGVVILEDAPSLPDGTPVRVETGSHADVEPPPGTPQAVLTVAGTWRGEPGELEGLLQELRDDKWAEVEAEQLRDQ